ncbi:ATP-binding protein [Corynebacterium sp.]|jgi:molecular chaperone HtpG|uniref:ATP-binding protein n=1 Tax=Corynebacterium sp. TaxID=1720 RepID=UPI0025C43DC5|nr:ATP-binding protein [Corynebacterium sp.]
MPMHNGDQNTFQVDLGGVVDLLSRHIYSGRRVYLRELLQNGVDAIAARRETDPAAPGTISIRPLTADRETFSLTDTGTGLTADEARDLLTTVGRTSKRDEFGLQREGRLGQFGVGLLSCFMVADGITMISRAATPGASAIRWTGFADGTFELTELTAEQTEALPVGTTTHLTPRPDERSLLTEDAVVRTAPQGSMPADSDWVAPPSMSAASHCLRRQRNWVGRQIPRGGCSRPGSMPLTWEND